MGAEDLLAGPAMQELAQPPVDDTSLKAWRSRMRKALVAQRIAAPAELRARWSEAIEGHLETLLAGASDGVIGFCWPYKGEFDPRATVLRMLSMGARAALPVVVAPDSPLDFRLWKADSAMEDGAYGIPIPRDGALARPDVLLLPANGFDEQGYRLGYGGGYFDRTLASLQPRPLVIGISFEFGRLATIHPQAHDMPLDYVVTESGAYRREPQGLRPQR